MNKKIILGGLAGAALMLGLVTTAFAYQNDVRPFGYARDPQHIAAIDAAFKNNDLATLNQLMTAGCRAGVSITKDNVATYATMWKYMQEGNSTEVRKLRDTLGYPANTGGFGMMGGRGAGRGMMRSW